MITEFAEGEAYTNPKLPQDIMVLGVASETQDSVSLSILWIDRDTTESTKFDELTVQKKDFSEWTVKEYD